MAEVNVKTAQGGLLARCRSFVDEQAAGEWYDETIDDDAKKLVEFVRAETAEMLEALKEARLQIDYMQGKFAVTGTGAAVLSKIDRAIAKAEAR